MALTNKEQLQFDQIEAALNAEDPALSSTLSSSTPERPGRGNLRWPAAAFLLGFALLVAGLPIGPGVGLVVTGGGFVLMVTAAVAGAPRTGPAAPRPGTTPASRPG